MHRIARSGLLALAAVLGSAVPVSAAAAGTVPVATVFAPVSARPTAPRPLAGSATGFLIAVSRISCGTAQTCLAVGLHLSTSGKSIPVAQAWNGTKWTSVAVPVPKEALDAGMSGVSCTSAASCLAVGQYGTKDGSEFLSFAVTWNGTALKPAPAPPMPAGTTIGTVEAVSCVTASSCVAVGSADGNAGSETVVDAWNGTKWTLHTPPLPSGIVLAQLTSVSCVRSTYCVVAGDSFVANLAPGVLIASWNGTKLTPMKVPVPAGPGDPEIISVSCFSAASCAAAGFRLAGTGTKGFGFTERWNGTSWKAATIAWPKGTSLSLLTGVSCASAGSCVAVGGAGTAKTGSAVAVSLNGGHWSLQHVPGPAKGMSDDLEGVSCLTANHCVAIGQTGPASGNNPSPLAGFWNGSVWKLAAALAAAPVTRVGRYAAGVQQRRRLTGGQF